MSHLKVSMIIPFYNDVDRLLERLPLALNFFTLQDYKSEIIIVDDGSDIDHSEKILAAFPELKVIRYTQNQGKGYAVKTGVLAALGKYIFYTDADLPFGMQPIHRALDYLERKEFDMVIGDRGLPGSNYHIAQTKIRSLASKIFTAFIGRIVVTGVKDTQCGFKGFKAEIAHKIFSRISIKGFGFDVEVVYIAFKHNFDLKRIPVTLEHNTGSTLRLHLHAWKMLIEVFSIKWHHLRGDYD